MGLVTLEHTHGGIKKRLIAGEKRIKYLKRHELLTFVAQVRSSHSTACADTVADAVRERIRC